jgi:nucleoside-diphosphate-sugar epimerase
VSSVLVSGATGFIGFAVVRCFAGRGVPVTAMVRKEPSSRASGIEYFLIEDILSAGIQLSLFEGVDCVIHAAGKAHAKYSSKKYLTEMFRVNAKGTRIFAEAAAKAGVRRFVFLSTIAVHGDISGEVRENSPLMPRTPYGTSKLEAERALEEISRSSGMEVVILRLPMVYGPGAPGNPRRLARLIAKGVPIPVPA